MKASTNRWKGIVDKLEDAVRNKWFPANLKSSSCIGIRSHHISTRINHHLYCLQNLFEWHKILNLIGCWNICLQNFSFSLQVVIRHLTQSVKVSLSLIWRHKFSSPLFLLSFIMDSEFNSVFWKSELLLG